MPRDERHDSTDESAFARELPGALRSTADRFPGPSPDLTHRGHTRGRRMRRTRNRVVGVAAGALTAAVIGGSFAVARLGGDSDTSHAANTPVGTSASPAAATTAPAAPKAPDVSADEVLRIFTALLPAGGSVAEPHSGGTDVQPPSGKVPPGTKLTVPAFAGVVYTDAKGTRTGVNIEIGFVDPQNRTNYGTCAPKQYSPYSDCTATTLSDGTKIARTKGYTYPNANTGQKEWTVSIMRPDDTQISVDAYGGGGEKATTKSVDPGLTLDQLTAIAQSPTWQPVIDAVPRVTATPRTPSHKQVDGVKILELLKSMLPPNTRITSPVSQPGFGSFIADDGRGESDVEINVQNGMGNVAGDLTSCATRGLDAKACTVTTLPDGSTLVLIKQLNEKGGKAVVWTADMVTTAGFRVVVSAVNAPGQAAPVSRPEPLLSLDQLKTIALDPRWATL
ncbi:hypothetical protein [Yinghuangia seranimata]|uniref:hypothetical protein n=1 Tax=Yinghuangia seranimata TaxID=408067 RepID=UPI00248D13FD|nr:hypothetical protein [Yinghuangia seranimata]MDI2130805.1 hypothetical protein [Yinghuangia seranimata]